MRVKNNKKLRRSMLSVLLITIVVSGLYLYLEIVSSYPIAIEKFLSK